MHLEANTTNNFQTLTTSNQTELEQSVFLKLLEDSRDHNYEYPGAAALIQRVVRRNSDKNDCPWLSDLSFFNSESDLEFSAV